MSSPPEQLKSTRSYIWYTGHVLGTGATSNVYIGRHKKTGEQVAVKTFNSASFSRPQEVQVRELNVIKKIKHKDIVDLLAIEDDQITKQPVIIMEPCMGGSLYSILEEPQNIFGLKEDEFLIVLRDVTSGMKYLRETNIVHRDLKPGNIMKVFAEDNTSIYKLADFGAAWELQDGGEFMSLYGTEEYLHPDLYQRAVLKVANHGRYSAKIDLWSVGVTFYHVATGQLPFRPYGGRKNRETMIYLTTKKPNGVISGVQYDSPTGKIVWSSQLPDMCHLPSSLKKHIRQLLAGLLECNIQRMWSFDEFFTYVQDILGFKKVHVFNAVTSQAVTIYIPPRSVWNDFTAEVEEETRISTAQQLLCFKEEILDATLSMEIKVYLQTSPQNPIILLRKDPRKFPPPIPPPRPKLPKIMTPYTLENDASLAKVCCGSMYYYLTVVMSLLQMQDQMGLTVKCFCGVLQCKIRKIEVYLKDVIKTHKEYIELALDWLVSTLNRQNIFIDAVQQRDVLMLLDELMHMQQGYKQEISDPICKMFEEFEVLFRRIVRDRVLETAYDDKQKCQPNEHCHDRFEVLVKETKTILDQFKDDKRSKRLAYNKEQIPKMDKQKLSSKCTQGMSLLTEHCELKWREQHNRLGSWYTRAYFDFQSVTILMQKIEDTIRKFLVYRRRLEEFFQRKDAIYLRGSELSYARAVMSPTVHQTSHKRLMMRDHDHEGVSNLKYSRQHVQEPPRKLMTSLMTNANQHHTGHPQQCSLVAGSSVFQQGSLYTCVPVSSYNPNTTPSTMQPMPMQSRPIAALVENRCLDRQINAQQVTWYNPNAPPSTMQPMQSMPMAAPVENRFLDRQINAQQVSPYNPNAPPSTMQPMPMHSMPMPVAAPVENRFLDNGRILQSEVGAKTGRRRRINAQQVSSHAPSRMPTTAPGENRFPNRRINEHDLNTFAGNMGADWKSLMRNLGLKENEIFHASCGCYTERDKIFACLVKWRNRQAHNATVREFVRMCINNEIDVDTYKFLSN